MDKSLNDYKFPWIPFSSGTEFLDWRWNNCDTCNKDWDGKRVKCDLENKLSAAAGLSRADVERIGYLLKPFFRLAPRCKEWSAARSPVKLPKYREDLPLFDGL